MDGYPPLEEIQVITSLDNSLSTVFIDPLQIEQVVINLITNACQAMPEGGILEIKAKIRDSDMLILFKDTGIGIPGENLDKLFEPLFTTKARGIGLGLSVAKNLAEINGGRIEVESEEGRSSTFSLILPLKETES
ncbi:MAG: hypothetical protein JRD68_09870 [Deltaproteobacteria bacterium]|nr:hypothetical protein [Deltaproteobacteria bacterium]